jgi:DNA repair protein RecN (Recombination protein N)
MLTHLSIRHFTIVEQLDIELGGGMTAITGETGAGKSIMLDALGLCLGDRADARSIRPGCEQAEITACFDVSGVPAARQWLEDNALAEGEECLLRRVIGADRSRAFINGRPATVQQCARLGEHLVDIHSQHAHQSLLRRDVQRALLDDYASAAQNASQVAELARAWAQTAERLHALRESSEDSEARRQLLQYQVGELDELAASADEIDQLEAEQKQLANAEDILQSAGQALALCEELEGSAQHGAQLLDPALHSGHRVDNAREMLASAAIQAGEARSDLQAYLDNIEVDPQRLAAVEKRLDSIFSLARKHRVKPESLPDFHAELRAELDGLEGGDGSVQALEKELEAQETAWREAAAALSERRAAGAKRLQKETLSLLKTLSMGQCSFQIALTPRRESTPHTGGAEEIELLISTNPGSPPQPLGRIASGGELSRISLAIQVATAGATHVPAMVFDEVDVGIGGAVAEVVGLLLRRLATGAQVLCVTHLPQVAAQADQQLRVSKSGNRKAVATRLEPLDAEGRVEELARMLGGLKVTAQTRAHAREMLTQSEA